MDAQMGRLEAAKALCTDISQTECHMNEDSEVYMNDIRSKGCFYWQGVGVMAQVIAVWPEPPAWGGQTWTIDDTVFEMWIGRR